MKRAYGRIAVMTFDLGTQVAVTHHVPTSEAEERRYYGVRAPVEAPYGPSQVRAAVRQLIPKFRAYLEARHA